MSAHNEGLTWLARRTDQFRYSVNGQDQWLQPLSIYTVGEAIKRGQPVSIVVYADTQDAILQSHGVVTATQTGNDNVVVLTRADRHTYSIGFAMESAVAGGSIHVLESGRLCYLAANSATEYWPGIFTDASRGFMVYAGPTAGSLTFSAVEAVTGGRNLIQLGSISNTTISGVDLIKVDIEVSITGDGRGPIDNTQFEMVTGEVINYTGSSPYNFPPLCAISDGTVVTAGTAILADCRYQDKSNVLGFMLNAPSAVPIPSGSNCIFLRKGRLNVSGAVNALIPGARYYLANDGQITASSGSVVYPNALVEVGTAVSTTELIVDISLPLLGVSDYPLGTLRPLTGDNTASGYLVCDGFTPHAIMDYQDFYNWAITQTPNSVVTTIGAAVGDFIVIEQLNPATGLPYQIVAYTPSYEPLSTITDFLREAGTTSGAGVLTMDLTPFTTCGPQNSFGMTLDRFIPELYLTTITASGDHILTKIPADSWTLLGNTLIGTVAAHANTDYILVVYRPEALGRYQETSNILSVVNISSGYAVNSTAVINRLQNDGAAETLILGNNVSGSIVRILGNVQFGDSSALDGLTIEGPVVIKTDGGTQTLSIDNATGLITAVNTSQNYPTADGHLVNKAYSDLHGIHTTVAVGGSIVNGTFTNTAIVHGISMGVTGGFDADMIDERHVGGYGWRSDSAPSASSGLPTARSAWIPEITSAGVAELGKQVNLYLTSFAAKPAVGYIAMSLTAQGATSGGPSYAPTNPYLLIVGGGSSGLQAVQIGKTADSRAVNLIVASGNNLLVTSDSIPNETPSNWATIKAAAFQTVSTIQAKKKVIPFTKSGLEIIKETEIVQYELKTEDRLRVGFIAEWTDELLAGKNHDENDLGTTLGVALKAIQELAALGEELQKDNKKLQQEIEVLKETAIQQLKDDKELLKEEIEVLKTAAIKAKLPVMIVPLDLT